MIETKQKKSNVWSIFSLSTIAEKEPYDQPKNDRKPMNQKRRDKIIIEQNPASNILLMVNLDGEHVSVNFVGFLSVPFIISF